jgi:mediator of RNA polymerase II transcription subunit 5
MLAERLEHFRTQTLVPLEPMSKKAAQVVSDEMDQMMEAGISGMNSIHVEDLPILNSRAGLYVYLSSMVKNPDTIQ